MKEAEREEYYDKVHFWGRLTQGICILFFLGISVYLSFIAGYHPGWKPIMTAFFGVAAMVGHTWINVGDLTMYVLLMGPAATYMSMLTGNIKNMRLPSAMAACAMLDAQEDPFKRNVLATFGVAASVVVNTVFLVILVMEGRHILKILSPPMLDLLNYIVPALFGAIFAQFAAKDVLTAFISLLMVVLVLQIKIIPSSLQAISAIILSVAANLIILELRGKNKKFKDN